MATIGADQTRLWLQTEKRRSLRILSALLAASLAGCSAIFAAAEPSEDEMRSAYQQSEGAKLGADLFGGTTRLDVFRKIACTGQGEGVARCRFFAKFGLESRGEAKLAVVDDLVGAASGFTRDATFIRSADGGWICTEVTVPDLGEANR